MCESGAVLRDEPVGKKRRSCSVAGPIERGSLKKKNAPRGGKECGKKRRGVLVQSAMMSRLLFSTALFS
jgi:hypothetical protein